MADFNFSSLIDSLNPQIAAGGPKIDFLYDRGSTEDD
jgi:hypothetical protein